MPKRLGVTSMHNVVRVCPEHLEVCAEDEWSDACSCPVGHGVRDPAVMSLSTLSVMKRRWKREVASGAELVAAVIHQ